MTGMENGAALHLIARIAGQRVALPTTEIDSVVEIESVTPVPRAPAHVVGLAALRSRVMTLIDCEAALGLPPGPPADLRGREAIVLASGGHLYGLLVDRIEDVAIVDGALHPLRSGLASGWARVASGLTEHDGAALLVIDPAALLAGPALVAA